MTSASDSWTCYSGHSNSPFITFSTQCHYYSITWDKIEAISKDKFSQNDDAFPSGPNSASSDVDSRKATSLS